MVSKNKVSDDVKKVRERDEWWSTDEMPLVRDFMFGVNSRVSQKERSMRDRTLKR